jgi:PTH1 family peptidyl-tRNA hydrolase
VYLVVGLGNPGVQYKDTRHNAGFMVLERWAHKLGVKLNEKKFNSNFAYTEYEGKKILLLCPLTYMNNSGSAVSSCVQYYGINLNKVLVVHDDIDLPMGRLKLVVDGGSGGHRGVQSVIDYLGKKEFNRLKIGVGRPLHGEDIEEYVLSTFYPQDKEILEVILDSAVKACSFFISYGIQSAMNLINCLNFKHKEVFD